jgi:hypothetical protein
MDRVRFNQIRQGVNAICRKEVLTLSDSDACYLAGYAAEIEELFLPDGKDCSGLREEASVLWTTIRAMQYSDFSRNDKI